MFPLAKMHDYSHHRTFGYDSICRGQLGFFNIWCWPLANIDIKNRINELNGIRSESDQGL